MGYPDTFEGFMITSQEQWSKFTKKEFKPKPFGDHDVDVKIEACGVCGSDVHTITGGWGKCNLPICVGHEIVGHVVKAGPKVTLAKVGDRVGVGAQVWACLKCEVCKKDNENYCPHLVHTYNSTYADGSESQGGYASHIRAHEHFTFPIPEKLDSAIAAPLLCAGITVWSPLVRAKIGPGKKVAILGIGGLGHLALIFSRALGAETYALSHSPHKRDDALQLGAGEFVVTGEPNWSKEYEMKFDFILNTADMTHTFDLKEYMRTLAVDGTFHNVGMPDEPLPELRVQDFMFNGPNISASHLGSRREILAMLDLVAKQNLKTWIETIDIIEKGCKEAVERVKAGKVHYRFTLVGYDKAFA
ncbi:GroES-like protein [Fistulina hepatica ATCC 64428]|uniref:alcohol dehydrogenase (NADP(+)) n=1 Tax=Fistulina hepatica ATCC 64428 TaxID=1128425 RepID=A0A0D6ZZL1_9AGAR|nr:GroES-like protein [Fistulina hepatica ATCC 64428]